MTTAARPTFDPAKGGTGRGEKNLSALSKQYSARDLPSHLKLKTRQHGQASSDELKNKDFKKELEERERIAQFEKDGKRSHSSSRSSSSTSVPITQPLNKKLYLENRRQNLSTSQLDADEKLDDDKEDVFEESDSDDDSEDDTQALLAELNRIKRERATEEAKREEEKRAQENKIRMENILSGNPLLNSAKSSTEFRVKRRWDDDVVFKNCAKDEPKNKDKLFINDTLRSDFHKKFMEKYIK